MTIDYRDNNRIWTTQHSIMLVALALIGVYFFEFFGQTGAIEFADSAAYTAPNIWQGIMPVYHLFIKGCKCISGTNYLQLVAALQGLLAVCCTCTFVTFCTCEFKLKFFEMAMLWLCTLAPYSVELPAYVNTHVIFTEGIAYSLYYVFVIMLYRLLVKPFSFGNTYLGAFIITLLMALIRPQLLLLLVVLSIVSAFRVFKIAKRMPIRILSACTLLILTVVVGIVCTFLIRNQYLLLLNNLESHHDMTGCVGNSENIIIDDESVPTTYDVTNDNDDEQNYTNEEYVNQKSNDQLGRAIAMRGIYVAKAQDEKYYSYELDNRFFKLAFREMSNKRMLYDDNPGGLYGWRHIANTEIYDEFFNVMYLGETNTGENRYLFDNFSNILTKIGMTEILLHPFKYIYCCMLLSVPGFISTVFFNIEKIYLLCHIYTAIIYLVAVILSFVLCKSHSDGSQKAGMFIALSILCNVVFVVVTNIMFFGMQRYFLYVFGVFYCGLYLGLRTLVHQFMKIRKS